MIEVILSNGDSAEAETPEAAVFAAETLYREATTNYYDRPTISFFVDGKCVAADLRRQELGYISGDLRAPEMEEL
jgi:hypothetical protein